MNLFHWSSTSKPFRKSNVLKTWRFNLGNHLHSAPISVKPKFALDADEGTVKLRCWFCLHKTGARVERGVPRDVRVGAKRNAVVAALLRLNFGGLHERSTPALSGIPRGYGQLLQVTDAVDLENMDKAGYVTVVELSDEDEAGL